MNVTYSITLVLYLTGPMQDSGFSVNRFLFESTSIWGFFHVHHYTPKKTSQCLYTPVDWSSELPHPGELCCKLCWCKFWLFQLYVSRAPFSSTSFLYQNWRGSTKPCRKGTFPWQINEWKIHEKAVTTCRTGPVWDEVIKLTSS